ncbi:hypothetical protein GCM10009565_76600 [Amycolatopsis albidoflavus]
MLAASAKSHVDTRCPAVLSFLELRRRSRARPLGRPAKRPDGLLRTIENRAKKTAPHGRGGDADRGRGVTGAGRWGFAERAGGQRAAADRAPGLRRMGSIGLAANGGGGCAGESRAGGGNVRGAGFGGVAGDGGGVLRAERVRRVG